MTEYTTEQLQVQKGALLVAAVHLGHVVEMEAMSLAPNDMEVLRAALGILRDNRDAITRALKFRADSEN